MKIAITADIHLTNRERHPERFHALENILDQLVDQEVNTLIIAGDLFDASCTTPGLFEDVVKKKNIQILRSISFPETTTLFCLKVLFPIQTLSTSQRLNRSRLMDQYHLYSSPIQIHHR